MPEQSHIVWRSVPMGPLVLGDSDFFVTYTTRRSCPFEAKRGEVLLGRYNSVADAQRCCEVALENEMKERE